MAWHCYVSEIHVYLRWEQCINNIQLGQRMIAHEEK